MIGPRNASYALGLLLVASFLPIPALASSSQTLCTNLPRVGWISADEIEDRLRRDGFQLQKLRMTNEACFVALVTNASGEKLELRIHPGNGERLGPPEQPLPPRTR
ncbi:MAG: PepSY domain-containing protein [Beijerinckiaceae bacterium]|nr:PepSY domain-containing protein [Beijerinckiaceae bacterium]